MSTLGEYNSEIAKEMYSQANREVDSLIEQGKIKESNREYEFARIVSQKLKSVGAKVPQRFLEILKK